MGQQSVSAMVQRWGHGLALRKDRLWDADWVSPMGRQSVTAMVQRWGHDSVLRKDRLSDSGWVTPMDPWLVTPMVLHWDAPSEGPRDHGSVSQMDPTSVDGTVVHWVWRRVPPWDCRRVPRSVAPKGLPWELYSDGRWAACSGRRTDVSLVSLTV